MVAGLSEGLAMPDTQYAIEITARTAQFQAEMARAANAAQANTNKIKSSLEGLNSRVSSFGKSLAGAIGIPLGVGELLSVLGSIKDKTIEGERAIAQLDAVLKSTGASAGLTRAALEEIGKGLQSKTVFDDDEIRKAQTALLQFGKVHRDVFDNALSLTADLATRLNTDLPTAATAIGKALTDPERGLRALKQAGLDLSEQNKDLAARFTESGNRAAAQKIVLDELTKSIGGAAEADNVGLYGATKRLSRSWDDLKKAFGGKILSDNAEELDQATGALERLNALAVKTRFNLTELATKPGAFLGLAANITATAFNLGQGERAPFASPGDSEQALAGHQLEQGKAAAAQATATIKAAGETQYLAEQAALKKRADGASAFYGAELAKLRATLDAQSSALEFAHQQNEISDAAYYDRLRKLAQDNLAIQADSIRKQQLAQEALLTAPSSNTDVRAGAEQKLLQLTEQNAAAIAQRDKSLQEINQKQSAGVIKLTDDYSALNIQLLQVQGSTVEAGNAAFELAHKEARDKIAAQLNSTDPAERAAGAVAKARLIALGQLTDKQLQLNAVSAKFADIIEEVGIAQSRVAIQVSSGQLTELEGLQKLSEANAKRIGDLRGEQKAYEELAATLVDADGKRTEAGKRALLNAEQLKLKIEELGASTDLVARKFNDIGSSSLSSFLQDLASGKGFMDSLKSLGSTLQSSISKVVSDNLSQMAFGKGGIFGGFGETLSMLFGGGKDVAGGATLAAAGTTLTASGTILTTAGTLLTGAATALTAAAAAMGVSSAASAAGAIGKIAGAYGGGGGGLAYAANGALFTSGGPYVVGERGPEIVWPGRGGRVTPNDQMRSMVGDRNVYAPTINMNVYGGNTQTMRQAAKMTADRATSSMRRG